MAVAVVVAGVATLVSGGNWWNCCGGKSFSFEKKSSQPEDFCSQWGSRSPTPMSSLFWIGFANFSLPKNWSWCWCLSLRWCWCCGCCGCWSNWTVEFRSSTFCGRCVLNFKNVSVFFLHVHLSCLYCLPNSFGSGHSFVCSFLAIHLQGVSLFHLSCGQNWSNAPQNTAGPLKLLLVVSSFCPDGLAIGPLRRNMVTPHVTAKATPHSCRVDKLIGWLPNTQKKIL